MNKQEFMNRLKRALSALPEQERAGLITDYEEHFENGLEAGRSEEEISASLGNPAQIGRSARIESLLSEDQPGNRARGVARALFASTSLGFFNVLFVIGPYAGLVGGMVGLWAGAVSLAISGVGSILLRIVGPLFPGVVAVGGLNWLFVVFGGIGVSALGVLAVFGMWRLSQLFIEMTRRYIRFNVRLAKGAGK